MLILKFPVNLEDSSLHLNRPYVEFNTPTRKTNWMNNEITRSANFLLAAGPVNTSSSMPIFGLIENTFKQTWTINVDQVSPSSLFDSSNLNLSLLWRVCFSCCLHRGIMRFFISAEGRKKWVPGAVYFLKNSRDAAFPGQSLFFMQYLIYLTGKVSQTQLKKQKIHYLVEKNYNITNVKRQFFMQHLLYGTGKV